MLRAVVFDFDGVIANSEPLHFRAFRDVLADEGVDADRGRLLRALSRLRRRRRVRGDRRGARPRWTPNDIAELVARKAVRLEALERDGSVLFPGAADAIAARGRRDAARDRVGRAAAPRSGACSNASSWPRCFTAIVAAEDTPVSKPAPDPYLRAVALLVGGMRRRRSPPPTASPSRIRSGD